MLAIKSLNLLQFQ